MGSGPAAASNTAPPPRQASDAVTGPIKGDRMRENKSSTQGNSSRGQRKQQSRHKSRLLDVTVSRESRFPGKGGNDTHMHWL